MPQKPQRPFVPHRTPTTPRPAITVSEFRLSPPFVPGSGRETGPPRADQRRCNHRTVRVRR